MKINPFIFYLIAVITAQGCSNDFNKKSKAKEVNVPKTKNWIYPEQYNFLDFNNVSFPVWFNADWLLEKNIRFIKIEKHVFDENNRTHGINFENSLPEVSRQFTFKNGELKKYIINECYDDKQVGQYIFDYPKLKDSFGYCKPYFNFYPYSNKKTRGTDFYFEVIIASNRFLLLEKKNYNTNFTSYYSPTNSAVGITTYLKDSAEWNYYKIDNHFEPEEKDEFIYGTPQKPIEHFNLKNLIKQDKVTSHTYSENGLVRNSVYQNGVSNIKRSYNYSKTGLFEGFIDSTFAGSTFVIAKETQIFYDSISKPYQIIESQIIDADLKVKKNVWIIDVE